ncbi:MAG: chemotaxis protein CheW [Nitrospira sp.]|nr:chemotaxis protein CheW [Nitrospira sp.]
MDKKINDLNQQAGLSTDGSQFLTFSLGEDLYGVDILRVQEIKGYTVVTKIPNTPPHIKGVLNLRGTIVPIIELRTKFRMPTIDYTALTVIVVVVVQAKVMGLVVDAVWDVLDIEKKDIQSVPDFGNKVDVTFLNGIGKSGDKLVSLLDLDRLLLDLVGKDSSKDLPVVLSAQGAGPNGMSGY